MDGQHMQRSVVVAGFQADRLVVFRRAKSSANHRRECHITPADFRLLALLPHGARDSSDGAKIQILGCESTSVAFQSIVCAVTDCDGVLP
jgi:hypothetical protein